MILVLGDSHTEHLLPGLKIAANETGVALFPRYQYGCSPLWTDTADETLPAGCAAANEATMREIVAHKDQFSGVLLAYAWPMNEGLDGSPAALVAQLRSLGLRILVVADSPLFEDRVPLCFARRGAACDIPRQEVERQRKPFLDRFVPIVAGDRNVRLWDSLDGLCSPTVCPVYRDGYVIYRDGSHLSLAASESLARYWPEHLRWLAGEEDDALQGP
jgi:hypothetical protein